MKTAELKELSVNDLHDRLAEERAEYKKLSFTHSVSGLENPLVLRNKKKNVARVLTEINARRKEAEAK